jgi:hypothetical protein
VLFILHCLQMESIMYLTPWSRGLFEKVVVLQVVIRSGAAHWHYLPEIHLNITCVCFLTCSKWLEWLMNNFICTYKSTEMHLKSACVFYNYILFSSACSGSSEPSSGRTKYKRKHNSCTVYKNVVQHVYIFTSNHVLYFLAYMNPVPLS